ncbi:MAG: helicase-associated domain-containing protein [Solirubrobacteraceae bacterium]
MTEHAAQRDLLAVLRLVETGRVAVSDKTRRPGAATIRLVSDALEGGDFYVGDEQIGAIKAFAWPMLLQAAGLAAISVKRLALTTAGGRALRRPPVEALARIWARWQTTRLLDELLRVEAIKGQTGLGRRGLTAAAGRRAAIAAGLADCPVGRWVGVDELFGHLRGSGRDFEVTRDAWRLYVGEPQYGSLGYDGCGGWNILQARYALALLFEYAATLGIVDVAYVEPQGAREDFRELWGTDDLEFLSRYDGLTHVRVNALGAVCLGLADEYVPSPVAVSPALRVLPDLEVVAVGDLAVADRLTLDRFADQVADRVWRLEPLRLLGAVETGMSIADMRGFLAARSSTPLPDAVLRLLDDMAERAGALSDRGSARMIECADASLAVLIANDRRTRALCVPAGERTLVVPQASEAAFRRAVRKAGYVVV